MITLKVEGFAELESALRRLPQEVAGRVLARTLKKAGQPMAERWSDTAPRSDVPSSAGHAADTIKVRSTKTESDNDIEVNLTIGPDRGHFYLMFSEFGTIRQAARADGRRSWDALHQEILTDFGRDLGASIERAAKRLALKGR